jgi:lactoylglutathione lyase
MVTFTSLGHVAVRVKDMARSLDFYTRRLGFPEMLRLNYADGSLFLVYLRITDTQYLELFPNGVGDKVPEREALAINHICVTTDDIERTLRELAEAGIPLTRELKLGPDGNRQAWIEDPDGVRIEIMEMAQDSMQAQAISRVHRGEKPIVRTTDLPAPVAAVR